MRIAVAATLLLSALASSSAAAVDAAEQAWLSVVLRAPERSVVGDEALVLSAARREQLAAAGYGYVDLWSKHALEIDARGLLHSIDTYVRHYLTQQGVREFGNFEIFARAKLERLSIEEAWVLRADGVRTNFDPRLVQVQDDPEDGLFSDAKRVVLPFNSVVPGTTMVVVTRSVSDPKAIPLPWSRQYYPQSVVPVEHFDVSWDWSAESEAPFWKTDDPELVCQPRTRGMQCKHDLVPAIPRDPDVRSWRDHLKHVVVAAPVSWSQLAARERAVFEEKTGPDSGLRTLALKLTGSSENETDRFEHLRRYVADEIRYVGLEHGSSAVIPKPARVTWQRGFGDCKDKVALFLALARATGVNAFPVLVATNRFVPSRVLAPSGQYFNHAIVCMRNAPGSGDQPYTCADLTVPELPSGLLPQQLHGAVALLLDGESERPISLPAARFSFEVDIKSTNEVACDGSIHERVDRWLAGPTAWQQRLFLQSVDVTERERLLAQTFRAVMGDVAKPVFEVADKPEPLASLRISSDTTYPATTPLREWRELAEPDPWLRYYAEQINSQNRHYPYYQSGLRVTHRATYVLCPDVKPTFPGASLTLRAGIGSLLRTYTVESDRVLVETTLELPSGEVPVASLPKLDAFVKNALAQTRVWFGLAPAKERRD